MSDPSTETTENVPTAVRRLDGVDAERLARLVGAYDDMQTVLQSCERLITLLGQPGAAGDVITESLWTLILLSYARGFGGTDAPLTEDDLAPAEGDEVIAVDPTRWHRVLLHLRDQHADPATNPRETFTVGVAQDETGAVNAIAVTSVPAPVIDPDAVREAGKLAYPLCALLDTRIGELQKSILADVRDTPLATLEAMDLIEVVGV